MKTTATISFDEAALALRPVPEREAQRLIDPAIWAGLSDRQRRDLCYRLAIVRGWRAMRRIAVQRRGDITLLLPSFLHAIRVRIGFSVSERQLRDMCRRYRFGGAAALVDTRGRPRGRRIVDALCVVTFAKLVAGGMSKRLAHERVRGYAVRNGLHWPRSYSVVAGLFVKGAKAAEVEQPTPINHDDPNGHLAEPGRGGLN